MPRLTYSKHFLTRWPHVSTFPGPLKTPFLALKEQRKRRRDEKANYRRQAELESKLKSEKRRLSYEKNIDEGCYPHSPESESDDHFHVTNPPLTPPPRPSVIRSNVADCTCGCTYVEMELDEEEIDVETV